MNNRQLWKYIADTALAIKNININIPDGDRLRYVCCNGVYIA